MDSDLSLIEIAGDDDSLLQQIPGDGISNLNTNRNFGAGDYFLCSPLQVPRPNAKPIGATAGNEGLEDTKHSFYRDGVNKENFNVDKAEMLKFSIEPQQMKRKKKGGGYNLRKSLAWDRAFFTEEGVLDPMELSMISGNFSKSKGETLSAIQEEETNCASNSSDLQALEENLFKKLPATTSEKWSNGGTLLPKKRNNEAPNSVATCKVLSAHDVNRRGSKRNGCPRPVASSSLKRPANLVTTTTSAKDSKVSKLPVQKTHCASSRIAKSTSTLVASDSKQNMITRPAVNAQINSGPRGSSNNTKNVVNSSKSGPVGKSLTTKTSLRQAKRTVPTSVKCSLSNVQLQLNTEANGDLEVILNPPLPSTRLAPKVQDDVSSKTAIPLPQTACHTSVSMQRTQLQMAKPSGLRMPSPSLGFFGQSKAPPLQNPSRRNSQPSNLSMSDTSNLRNLGSPITVFESRAPLAPRSLPEVIKDGARTGNIKASCATSGCSVPSAINPALHEIVESDSRVSNMQKMEQKVQCNDNVSKAIKGQKEFDSTFVSIDHQILGQTGQCTSKSTSQIEDLMQQRNDDDFLQTGTLQQVDKYDTNMKVVDDSAMSTKGSEIEENPDLTSHSSSASEVTAFSVKSNINDHLFAEDKPSYLSIEDHGVSSKINVGKCNVSESCGEQAEMMDALSCEAGPISSSEMLQNNVANISSEVQNNSVTEIEKSDAPSPLRSIEQKNDGTNSLQKVGAQLILEDAGVQSPDANTTVESSKSYISTLITNQHEVVVSDAVEKPEYLEFSKCLLTTEHALRDQVMLQVDDCLLGGKSFFPEESKLENNIQSDEPKGTDACESEFKRSSSPRLILVSMQDCGSDTAKLVERKNLEDILLVSVDSEPVVENYNQDAQFQNDVQLHGHSTSVELENMDEDHLTDAVSAEDVNVTCQRSGHFGGSGNFGESEREVPYITCEPSLKVQVEGDSWINHTPKHDDAEDKKINLSVESSCRNTNLKPEDKLSLDYDHSSMGKIYLLRGENDVSKHQEEQDEQVMPCFSEADRIPHEEKQSLEAHCLFHYLEKPQKSQDGNNTDVYLEVSVHDGSGLESLGQALKESEAANCMMGEPDGNSDLQDPVNQIPITDVDLEVGVHDGSGLESLGQALKESKAANCMKGEPDGNSDLQDPVNQINKVLLASVPGVSLDHVSLVDNSAEVLCEEIDFENVLKERDEGPIVHIDGLDVNKNAESLEVEVAATSSLEIALSVENMRCVTKCRHENELSKEANSPKSYLDPNVSNNQESVNCTHDIEQQHELENTLPTEDQDVTKKRENTGIEKKQDILVKPPPYATPFSDEWFAAFEAAGEEILTMKTGAVQNSPQDRSPEPGPWSPVKRKLNQEIGPFDCTKYTNTNQ